MTDLTTRIHDHLHTMAPHVKERKSARLLAEALQEIQRLRGLASWASGALLEAGDVEASEKVLELLGGEK